MIDSDLTSLFEHINRLRLSDDSDVLRQLMAEHTVDPKTRHAASQKAKQLVLDIRRAGHINSLDALLGDYGITSEAGTALLQLSEALMRVPDAATTDELIADKLVRVNWQRHQNTSGSLFVKLAAYCLATARFCVTGSSNPGTIARSRRTLKKVATPVVRAAVRRATRHFANRFVLGATIDEAIELSPSAEKAGFSYSYDMLGEAAYTEADAEFFFTAYKKAITALKPHCKSADFRENRGVSIKLSALHPRYVATQVDRVKIELTECVLTLARMAKEANMGLNIDAEEVDRLELSLEVIRRALEDSSLAGWDGFGIVVQAYGKAAPAVIDWLYQLAGELDRKIMIRLVKGAYWDTEIKRAQVEGIRRFPVFSRKAATDVAYICCAKKLLGMTDRIYPQFAGHNALTVSAILELAGDNRSFEFQRIHGMGEELHSKIIEREKVKCRIYAPVGEHRELLPYLARRMLENGANSSFVNQIVNRQWTPAQLAEDPFEKLERIRESNESPIAEPAFLFGGERRNSKGWDIHNPIVLEELNSIRSNFRLAQWGENHGSAQAVQNPTNPTDVIGYFNPNDEESARNALEIAKDWSVSTPTERTEILTRASDLFEANAGELFGLLCREAGKTLNDAVAELREAVDFLRYYALQTSQVDGKAPLGIVVCISPWNFPLAIFTGQIAGALAAGNGVIAKPATQTVLTGQLATRLLHLAGVPSNVLQLVAGKGSTVGDALVSNNRVNGVAFTGSTETASHIAKRMAEFQAVDAKLIAETGGLNAMVVDSSALPEQVVRDVLISSFQSAGQRCSALRILYLQEDIADHMLKMLFGAMDELRIGDPWEASTDVGPVISIDAQKEILSYIDEARKQGKILKHCAVPETGNFVPPTVISVSGIEDLSHEVFGPVLHVARFKSNEVCQIFEAINRKGFGLTFGLHTRIEHRVNLASDFLKIGNIYVNRNQIGAVVGSQPFGGEGLSGTGPKAGGQEYVRSLTRKKSVCRPNRKKVSNLADTNEVRRLLEAASRIRYTPTKTLAMPGPVGEFNSVVYWPRGVILCLGPELGDSSTQVFNANQVGCPTVRVCEGAQGPYCCDGFLERDALRHLPHIAAVVLWGEEDDLVKVRRALAERDGPIVPLITTENFGDDCLVERHTCIDTTAAGGNAALFESVEALR